MTGGSLPAQARQAGIAGVVQAVRSTCQRLRGHRRECQSERGRGMPWAHVPSATTGTSTGKSPAAAALG
jgi:hypothetical protein